MLGVRLGGVDADTGGCMPVVLAAMGPWTYESPLTDYLSRWCGRWPRTGRLFARAPVQMQTNPLFPKQISRANGPWQ